MDPSYFALAVIGLFVALVCFALFWSLRDHEFESGGSWFGTILKRMRD